MHALNQKVDNLKKQIDQRVKIPEEIQINQDNKRKTER